MEDDTFDALLRILARRRSALALLSAFGVGSLLSAESAAKRRKKKCKKKKCGLCQKCKKGKCKPQPDGADCGGGASCQQGECICPTECCSDADCPGEQVCDDGQCLDEACPAGEKPCQGECIPDAECCGKCPAGQVCCANVGLCKNILNDPDFCGSCTNGQCQGSDTCANGACSQECTTIGQVCLAPNCLCANRVQSGHLGEKVCAQINPFNCNNVETCEGDADCGFQFVCVSDICITPVCADPCT